MNIIHLVSNKVWGGGEQYVLDLSEELAAKGNKVTIVARNIPAVTQRFEEASLPVVTMPLKGVLDIISPFKLASMVRNMPEAIIHVHNFKDASTAIRARRISGNKNLRIVLTRHLVKSAKKSSIYKKIDAMIFVSQLALDKFLSSSPNIGNSKISVVHNSIKLPPFATADATPGDSVSIMFHGRLSPEKGIEILIKAFAKLNNEKARLVIAGSGEAEYTNSLKKLAAENGAANRIEWTGHIKNIHPLIEKADIGVCPSMVPESFGLAVIEYMAHGKPVITTNNGAQREYITPNVDGILVPPAAVEETANAIERLLNKEECARIGKAAKTTFDKKLAYPVFYKAIYNIYESLFEK